MNKKLIVFTITSLLLFVCQVEASESKVLYPTDDYMTELYEADGFTDWSEARNFEGEILLEPLTEGLGNSTGRLTVRTDDAVGKYRIFRSAMQFDLSGIDFDEVESVSLNLSGVNSDLSADSAIVITSHNRLDNNSKSKYDWNIERYGVSSFSEGMLQPNNVYTKFTFNESGVQYLFADEDGIVNLGVLTTYDFYNIEPSMVYTAGATWRSVESLENRPYLEIIYEVPDEPEEIYPLYTQGTSTHPTLEDTISWANDIYADGAASCGRTIGECGCALTSLVMAGRWVGITESLVESDVNPGNMNAYFKNVGGYNKDGFVVWLAGQAYLGEFVEGKLASRFSAPEITSSASEIAAAVQDEAKVVLGYKKNKGHFVWLTEKTEDGFLVNDPVWFNTKTANDVANADEQVTNYQNTFDSGRIFTVYDEPVVLPEYGIEAFVSGAAEMLYKSITGDRVGYGDDGVVIDLEGASYADNAAISFGEAVESDGKHLLVPDTSSVFSVEVIGTDVGEFSFTFFGLQNNGEITTYEFSGQTFPGVKTIYDFNLETGEVTERPISYEDFLTILNIVLADADMQEKDFFNRLAEMMFERMTDKTSSQAIQTIEVFSHLMVARKVDSPLMIPVFDRLKGQVR